MPRTRPTEPGAPLPRRGFTLVEATISILLVAMVVVTSMRLVGASLRMQNASTSRALAHHLARDLLDEILQAEYEEPDDVVLFGRESAEPASNRSAWDDVDDYANLTESPPRRASGEIMGDYMGWSRKVSVAWVNPSDPNDARGTETGVKRATVTVTDTSGKRISMTGLRTLFGAIDHRLLHRDTFTERVATTIRLGDAGTTAIASSALLLNRPHGEHNLLQNPGFETGTGPWAPGASTLVESGSAYGDTTCMLVTDRTSRASDINQSIKNVIVNGRTYHVEAWVRASIANDEMTISIRVSRVAAVELEFFTSPHLATTTWSKISGTLTPTWTGSMLDAKIRLSTEPDGSEFREFFVDDLVLREIP